MGNSLFAGPTVVSVNAGSGNTTVNGVPAGASIVVGVHHNGNSATVSSITCTGESNLTSCGAPAYYSNANVNESMQFFVLDNVTASGNKTITCTLSGGSTGDMVVWVITGGETTGFFDTGTFVSANDGGTPGTTASVNLTTSRDGDMVLAFVGNGFGGLPSPQSGYTTMGTLQNTNCYDAGEYNLNVGAAGVKTVSMTSASTGNWQIAAAAFKAAVVTTPGLGAITPPGPGVQPSARNQFRPALRGYLAVNPNVTLALTGQGMNFAQGNIAQTGADIRIGTINPPGPGRGPYWNGQFISAPKGFSIQNVTAVLTGQSATFSGGALAPGNSVPVLGISATFAAGGVAPNVSIALTGQSASFAAGTITSSNSLSLTGQAATSATGNQSAAIDTALTGLAATLSAGQISSVTGTLGFVRPPGPGISPFSRTQFRSAPRSNTQATTAVTVSLIGQAATFSAGSLSPANNPALAGQAATSAAGSVTSSANPTLLGQSASLAAGSIAPTTAVALSGQSANLSQGTVTPVIGIVVAITGQGASFAAGNVSSSINIPLTGSQMALLSGIVTSNGAVIQRYLTRVVNVRAQTRTITIKPE